MLVANRRRHGGLDRIVFIERRRRAHDLFSSVRCTCVGGAKPARSGVPTGQSPAERSAVVCRPQALVNSSSSFTLMIRSDQARDWIPFVRRLVLLGRYRLLRYDHRSQVIGANVSRPPRERPIASFCPTFLLRPSERSLPKRLALPHRVKRLQIVAYRPCCWQTIVPPAATPRQIQEIADRQRNSASLRSAQTDRVAARRR